MATSLDVLKPGSCEALKAGVHATALGLAVVMGVYNGAAWFRRRERHLGVNVILYTALVAWELKHVGHHLAQRRRPCGSDAVVASENASKPTKMAA